ncbi:hypothetical protein [Streptomyces sp. NPDC006463]|uniref:hypothetical protein n=1 Tax=Streptomyces sp. NPDC006463 TaxID=3364746 RepID=UPI0036A49B7E
MPSTEAAANELQDRATLWSVGEIPANDVVSAACDALVAGLDSPGLRVLAACTRAEADYDVHDLLPVALDELGRICLSTAGRMPQDIRSCRGWAAARQGSRVWKAS